MARRLWAKDPTVWAETDLPELTDRLGWLGLPDEMGGVVAELTAFAASVANEGIRFVVLLGMGGSSLAPEVFQNTFGNADGYPELIVLDSTHPGAVAAVDARIDLAHTLFLVASKSGTTLETLSFFRYFWNCLMRDGLSQGGRFVALTDPGSALEDLAAERGFRKVFATPPEVGGRYSALTYFGLVPAALIGADLAAILASAASAAQANRRAARENPGLILGAVWGEAALAGRDKLTVLTSPSMAAFPNWLEQLIAESTGKDGTGIVPIVGEDLAEPAAYGDDRIFLSYELDSDGEAPAALDALAAAGHPVVRIGLSAKEALGGAMFTAEVATAAAGALLGIHPFNQPDVQVAKELARQAMAGELQGGDAIEAALPSDATRLAAWIAELPESGYIGISAYVPMTAGAIELLQGLRHHLRHLTGAATTVGFGPRFLHSTGQLHKGGPGALFLQLVDDPTPDAAVPETDFSFGKLIVGQAEGDFRALESRRQRVLRVQLGPEWSAGLDTLLDAVSSLD
jgi:transaldolase/glucose-6-phosphate isomerase